MPYIDVTVEVYLNSFNDQELIDEIEKRGWIVGEEKNLSPQFFENEELDLIASLTQDFKPGTIGYEIYVKTKKGTQ
jgi:hypothetical protein